MSVCGLVAFRGSHAPTMARPKREGNRPRGLFPRLLRGLSVANGSGQQPELNDQLFSRDLILLSNSANEVSPLILSPLMKKVGVESTFSTSLAYFWSAAILSSSAW